MLSISTRRHNFRVSFVSFVSAVDTTCANADASSTSSGVRPETARRTSIVCSSYNISSHRRRRCRRRRGRAHTRRVRCLVHRRRASSTSYPPTSPPSRLARDRRAYRQSLRTFESRRRGDGYSRWSRPVDASTERRPPSRLVLARASSSPSFPSSISRARPASTMYKT